MRGARDVDVGAGPPVGPEVAGVPDLPGGSGRAVPAQPPAPQRPDPQRPASSRPGEPPRAPGGPVRVGVLAGPRASGAPPRRTDRVRAALVARRERLRADARANRVYRTVVGLLGAAVVLLGLVLVPLPGPGWLVVFLGLAVLGSEFHWARRLHGFAVRQVHRWTTWLGHRSRGVRAGLGAGAGVVVLAAAYGYLAWQGVPAWSPEVVTAQLTRVPGL